MNATTSALALLASLGLGWPGEGLSLPPVVPRRNPDYTPPHRRVEGYTPTHYDFRRMLAAEVKRQNRRARNLRLVEAGALRGAP